MNDTDIEVRIMKYADRRHFLMYYIDPITEKKVTRSTEETTRRDAERAAGKWEAELREGRYQPKRNITWGEFRERYETEKLTRLAVRTAEPAAAAFNHLERLVDPKRLSAITGDVLSRFQAALRKEGLRDTTIDAHLAHLRAAFSWAVSIGLITKVPEMQRPERIKGRKLMRGRPITAEEFDRLIAAVPKVRSRDAAAWFFYIRGLWLSGLRLEESLILSWDRDQPLSVDLSGRRPRFRILAEAEKGNKDRLLPMAPDFAELLDQVEPADRAGVVFKLPGLVSGQSISPKRVSKILTNIGRRAGVVVDRSERMVREKGADGVIRWIKREATKFASAHDLRRAYGTRWARLVRPATLKLMMRHSSIETTLNYYVEIDADDVADELWAIHGQRDVSGNTFGNTPSAEGSLSDALACARNEKSPKNQGF